MKVSIITPCYNSAAYISRAIASVQAQSISEWEMIVVDDGSDDDSAVIVNQVNKVDPRVKILQKENGGSASARKLGLLYAKGEYIQFLDAYDTISPDKFERPDLAQSFQYGTLLWFRPDFLLPNPIATYALYQLCSQHGSHTNG